MGGPAARRPGRRGALGQAGLVAGVSLVLALFMGLRTASGDPVHGAELVPSLPVALPSLPVSLPSLPVSLPSLPLPTPTLPLPTPTLPLPTPTLPLPSLPLPTPTLPLPTPILPLPTPTLPLPSGSPRPSLGATPTIGPGESIPATGSSDPGSTSSSSPAVSAAAPGFAGGSAGPLATEPPSSGPEVAPLNIVIPGLIAGIPLAVVALAVLAQVAGGAAWLPVVRRWLDRRLIPGPGRRLP